MMKPITRDNVEGTIHEVNGNIKEASGKLTDDPQLENAGNREKTLGKGFQKSTPVSKSPSESKADGPRNGGIMSQTILDRAGEPISDSARQASSATRAAAHAIAGGAGSVRRVAKQGIDVAEEFLKDPSRLIQRQPTLTVAATGAIALSPESSSAG